MKNTKLKDVNLRESARREIERQVQEFLKNGGEISTIESRLSDNKPKGAIWRPRFGNLELN